MSRRPPPNFDSSEDLAAHDRTYRGDPLIGQLAGEYVLKERIGTGGTGIVYRGEHPAIGKSVAVKVLKPELAAEPGQLQSLLDEAKLVTTIGDRGIVDVFGFGKLRDGRQYVVMEYLDGQRLDAVMEEGGLKVRDALEVLDLILRPLAAAHGAGVLHRDLKPQNVFLQKAADGSRFIKIVDFGLAKKLEGAANAGSDRAFAGTVHYAAPEQIRGERLDARTDLYAVGVIAHELLTGRLPFNGATIGEVLDDHLRKPPPPLAASGREFPVELEAFVRRLLGKRPEDRPASANEARAELTRMRRALPSSRPSSPGRKALSNPKLSAQPPRSEVSAKDTDKALDASAGAPISRQAAEAELEAMEKMADPASSSVAVGAGRARLLLYVAAPLVALVSIAVLINGAGAPEREPVTAAALTPNQKLLGRIDELSARLNQEARFLGAPADETALSELRGIRLSAAAAGPSDLAEVDQALSDWIRRHRRKLGE